LSGYPCIAHLDVDAPTPSSGDRKGKLRRFTTSIGAEGSRTTGWAIWWAHHRAGFMIFCCFWGGVPMVCFGRVVGRGFRARRPGLDMSFGI